jgi:hypothetical protein
MGHSLSYLADHSHGWPGHDSEWPTMDDWTAELKARARVLIAYSTNYDNQDDPPDIGPTIQRLSTYWGHLWD